MIQELYKYLLDLFRGFDFLEGFEKPLAAFLSFAALVISAWLAFQITRFIFLRIARRVARKTKTEWDDILLRRKVFNSLAHIVPAIIIFNSAQFAGPGLMDSQSGLTPEIVRQLSEDHYLHLGSFIIKWAKIYIIFIAIYIINTTPECRQ
jgi:miniconductance mechanosensitive channel